MSTPINRPILFLIVAFLLTSCGGGNGGEEVVELPDGGETTTPADQYLGVHYQKIADSNLGDDGAGDATAFPHKINYGGGIVTPGNYALATLEDEVSTYYDTWKARYVHEVLDNGSVKTNREFFVHTFGTAEGRYSVSEGHGYGMLITAMMAGYDGSAKIIFDGMYQFYSHRRSDIVSDFLCWAQVVNLDCLSPLDSATDGDMDIAYALLIADSQWGSDGDIDYLQAGNSIIDSLFAYLVNDSTAKWSIRLGDWAPGGSYDDITRVSDWMSNHFDQFASYTGNAGWTTLATDTYWTANDLFTNDAEIATTGLLPDFLIYDTGADKYAVPTGLVLESSAHDKHYYYNSARYPWRMAIDYILTGDTSGIDILKKLNSWIQTKTDGNPANIALGYELDGDAITSSSENIVFAAPLMVAAMVDFDSDGINQIWLDDLTDHVLTTDDNSYFGDTIKMLSLLIVSQNWLNPTDI